MEYNDWTDWGQSDWGNGWTSNNTISQNYNRQPTPKEQGSTNQSNRQNKVNQSASGYFENNSGQEDWFVQNQAQNVQGQTYSFESNNNNSINQIENREVAPPDNKQSYDTPHGQQNRLENQQSRPNQFANAPPPKGFHPRQQPVYNNMEPTNISNYFEPSQIRQNSPGRMKPFYSQPNDSFSKQTSGPSSFSGESLHQEQFGNEPHSSSLVHPVQQFKSSSNIPQSQQNNNQQQPPPNLNVGQQVKDMPPQQIQHTKPTEASQQHTGIQQHPSTFSLGHQPPLPQQHSSNSLIVGQTQNFLSQNSMSVPPQNSISMPSQNYMNMPPKNSMSMSQNSMSVPPQNSMSLPPQNSMNLPPQNSMNLPSQNSMNVPPQNSMSVPPQNSMNLPPHNSMNVPPQNSMSVPPQNSMSVPPQNSISMPPQNSLSMPPQNSMSMPPQSSVSMSQNSVSMPIAQQFSASNRTSYQPQGDIPTLAHQNFPSNVTSSHYSGVSVDLPNMGFDQQPTGLVQQASPAQEDQSMGMQQFSSEPPLEQQPHGVLQQMTSVPLERPPSAGQHPSNFIFGQQMKTAQQSASTVQQPNEQQIVDSRRLTPSPQQQISKPSNQPPTSHPPHQVVMKSEPHEVKTPLNHNLNHVNAQPLHVTNINLFPPIATSSPLPSNNLTLENQEGIPENKEFPDNAETIAQDFKALKISPPRDNEQEAQKHCAIDRNQYLETGQLSAQKENTSYLQNVDVNDEGDAPPPGLHRLVTGQGYEPWQVETETSPHPGQTGEGTPGTGATRHSSPLSSIGGESEGHDGDKDSRREVPGEAEPLQGRVVLGQVPTPPQDTGSNRGERERERLERMVVGEHGQSGNLSDDYRQSGRPTRHSRHIRNDSSFEEEERDYSSDRDRRNDDHRQHRDDRPRRRREPPRSPEYRSDEEYEDRRGYHRSGRESRRRRDYSPDRSYYRDYYREEDPRHHRSYYPREYDEYFRENQRSRPSSRSGSDYRGPLKHSMRVLPGHHYYHDPYTSAPTSFHDYNLKYSQRTIEYFERMRHVDPAGYAAWYSQYMQGRLMQESSRAFSSDRASVHSGQSSSNQRHGISTPQEVVDDLTREEDEVDYTPRLYDCAHIRGSMDGHGRLLIVEPNYPVDHQRASVNIFRLSQVALDRDSEDFFQSPGPFIPGITHRNTVLQYLKRISDRSTKSSEKLLYDLVYMTVKGNGEVNGSDVAELLMESYKNSMEEERDSTEERTTPVSIKEVTTKFRELLQQGNKAEALDWAMDNSAWGHALFLASKMGEKTHNDIMLRFANSIPHNDPLQTLYQLMSGYIPQSATCCADKKWSDWRPHLAMILSNPTGNIDLDRQAIITLGDSLNASGRLFASHFCYVTAQVEFSEYRPEAKLVLLGSSHNQDFSMFASCRSIMLTMCYEYGLKLRQPTFSIPTLQVYKLILAARLIDSGRIRNALQYCELLAQEIVTGNAETHKSLISAVLDMSSRLKMFDPVLALSGNTDKDPEWLGNLRHIYDSLPDEHGFVSHNQSPQKVAEPVENFAHVPSQEIQYQISDSQPNSFIDPGSGPASIGVPTYPVLSQVANPSAAAYQPLNPPLSTAGPTYQPLPQPISQIPPRSQMENTPALDTRSRSQRGILEVERSSEVTECGGAFEESYTELDESSSTIQSTPEESLTKELSPLSTIVEAPSADDMYRSSSFMPVPSMSQPPMQHNSMGYIPSQVSEGIQSMPSNTDSNNGTEPPWDTRPVLQSSSESLQPSRNNFYRATEEQLKAVDESKPTMKVLNEVGGERKNNGKPSEAKGPAKGEEHSSGWFGGIWDKLALRPKNQMRLPDDSNPSIIWDEKKKRWVNLDGDNESSGSAKPPPKASEALPPQGNKYKIQKGKLMKSNYVDVMGNKERGDNGSANYMPGALPPAVKTNFFIPQPVDNENAPIDFITPAPHNPVIDSADHSSKQQLSRSSSVSSLSREVQFYMAPPKGYHQPRRAAGNAPPMYNTSRFPS